MDGPLHMLHGMATSIRRFFSFCFWSLPKPSEVKLWSSIKFLNSSWRCQLLYEVLFVELEWELKHPDTNICQQVILTWPPPPPLLPHYWPKSPHHLGSKNTIWDNSKTKTWFVVAVICNEQQILWNYNLQRNYEYVMIGKIQRWNGKCMTKKKI